MVWTASKKTALLGMEACLPKGDCSVAHQTEVFDYVDLAASATVEV
jgi:hypothetical protein